MSIFGMLYQLLIGPLELFFEAIYGFSKLLFGNAGLSIFVLSMSMNVLLLPLYKRADAIQEEERQINKRLSPWVSHIKKTFSGDERYLMLQTYYRQNDYRPFYALRGSLPLLLEIPFFIAAYHFLSNLPELKGTAFGPIRDLGAPDGLLTIGTLTVHVLPILMTLINFVSSAIYTKGLSARDKIQLYGMALIFLVLLYQSPAGLVFYWTLNNLFSLVKNLIGRLKDPGRTVRIGLAVLGAALFFWSLLFYRPARTAYKLLLVFLAFLMLLPLLLSQLKKKGRLPAISLPEDSSPRRFFGGALLLTVLTGVLIPSAVIAASPAEFIQMADFYSPLRHVFNALLLAAGLFLVWFGIFYYLAGRKAKTVIEALLWVLGVLAIINYMFFGTKLGTLSAELKYDTPPAFGAGTKLINLGILAAAAVLVIWLWKKNKKLCSGCCLVLCLAMAGMSAVNLVRIRGTVSDMRGIAEQAPEEQAELTLSRDGKNVIIIMLDRAISSYLPYLFAENPALKQQYAGFTYYPNTVSHGAYTIFGAPGLWGGYEYTPEEMNKRSSETLKDKHNEALKVLPVLFDQAGYDVTVCDPTYAGYAWIPDLSIYSRYPDIQCYITEQGQFSLKTGEEKAEALNGIWKRNFFCYSLMKCSPLVLQSNLYQGGSYFASASFRRWSQTEEGISQAQGYKNSFMDSYAVLAALPSVTKLSEGTAGSLLIMSNSTTHEPMLLQEPAYQPAEKVDNREYDEAHRDRFTLNGRTLRVEDFNQMAHYQTNMAALMALGNWFDYLKANGVYDNSRIIIVSDHGRDLAQFDDLLFGTEYYEDVMFYNPLLLIKDFGAKTFTTDNAFMTNADVPAEALAGLIEEARNPFTGQLIDSGRKAEGPQRILFSDNIETDKNTGCTFAPGVWFEVDENIFDLSKWKKLGSY